MVVQKDTCKWLHLLCKLKYWFGNECLLFWRPLGQVRSREGTGQPSGSGQSGKGGGDQHAMLSPSFSHYGTDYMQHFHLQCHNYGNLKTGDHRNSAFRHFAMLEAICACMQPHKSKIKASTPSAMIQYDPLDTTRKSIRTINLLPGRWVSEVHCTLQTVSLSDKLSFDALSYVWGDPPAQPLSR
jgi:hypothetical protein